MKLGDVIKLNKHSLIDISDNKKYRIAGVQNYGQGIVIRRDVFGSELNMKKYQLISKNQLMWCKVDTKNGAFGLTNNLHVGSIASTNMALADIDENKIEPEFLEILFRQKPFADYITNLSSGSTNRKYLTPPQLFELVSLPDLNILEQRKFVQKLKRIESLKLYDRIQKAKEFVSLLKQSILLDAIKGNLSEEWRSQNPNTEAASILLKNILNQKKQLIKENKIKKEKPLPIVDSQLIPFEIPTSWSWCRLGDISHFFSGNNFDSSDFTTGEGIKCIKITNVGVGEVVETDDVLPLNFLEKHSSFLVYKNDIVIALTRPYIAAGLKVSICPDSYNKSLLNQRVAVIRPYDGVFNSYVYSYLRSDYVLKGYKKEFDSKGQQPNLKKEHVTELLIPIPPSEEQKVIVAKVDYLFAKCQVLENEILQSEKHASMLIKAVLEEVFETKTAVCQD